MLFLGNVNKFGLPGSIENGIVKATFIFYFVKGQIYLLQKIAIYLFFAKVVYMFYSKVRKFQNENMKSSHCPKYETFCPKYSGQNFSFIFWAMR